MSFRLGLFTLLVLGVCRAELAHAQSSKPNREKNNTDRANPGKANPDKAEPDKADSKQAERKKPPTDKSESTKPGKRAETARKGSGLTPEREAAVMTFVKLNHPDLEMLLTHLKQSEPKEYEKAVRDLTRVIDRLAASKDRDADMYELELRSWKAQSRLQLLSARQAMGGSDDLRDEMREVIREQGEVRAEMLKREKQRIQERLNKIDSELGRLEKNPDRWVEQQLKAIAGAPPESNKQDETKPNKSKPNKSAKKNERD
jgi:hypothetical protein